MAGLALILLCGLPKTAIAGRARGASSERQSPDAADGAARRLFDLVNGERRKAGLPALTWNEDLAAAAQRHSEVMARQRTLSHRLPGERDLSQRVAAVPVDRSGENVAVDSTGVLGAHEGLMQSPPHRANILEPHFNAVGIGVVQSGNLLWVTQDFVHEISRISDRAAADAVMTAVLRARSQAGLPSLKREESERLGRLACEMGKQNRLKPSDALRLPNAHYATAFTTTDPASLPQNGIRASHMQGVHRIAVGACFARNSSYPSGVYWVSLVLFSK